MNALTLHQPRATLITARLQTIITSDRDTDYRGRVALHASKHRPEEGSWPLPYPPWTMWLDEFGDRWLQSYEFSDPNTVTAYECWPMPLGAVVASCVLADVVPIVADYELLAAAYSGPAAVEVTPSGTLLLYPEWDSALDEDEITFVTDQLPFGDFSPGRYAWLLEDVKPTTERCPWCWGSGYGDEIETGHHPECPGGGRFCDHNCPVPIYSDCRVCEPNPSSPTPGVCDPIPAKGCQGLWQWDPKPVALPVTRGR